MNKKSISTMLESSDFDDDDELHRSIYEFGVPSSSIILEDLRNRCKFDRKLSFGGVKSGAHAPFFFIVVAHSSSPLPSHSYEPPPPLNQSDPPDLLVKKMRVSKGKF